jgi:hypothetical protein
MSTRILLSAFGIGAALTLSARADFFDNFDSYANQSAFNASWTVDTGAAGILALEGTNAFSSPNAIMQSTTVATRLYHAMPNIAGDQLDFSFQFEIGSASTRDFAQVYSRAGSAWTSGLNGALSFGTFNTTAAGKFAARFTQATPANGAIFGDGATIISSTDTTGWFALSISRTTNVWHLMEVKGSLDPNHSGKAMYSFYVDGVLGGSIANAPDSIFNFGVLGGANSTGSGTPAILSYYDDFNVSTVPEPATLGFALVGALGFALSRFRPRRCC